METEKCCFDDCGYVFTGVDDDRHWCEASREFYCSTCVEQKYTPKEFNCAKCLYADSCALYEVFGKTLDNP